MTPRNLIFLALTSVLLTRCAVGPDFKEPAAPAVTNYTDTPLTTTEATPVLGGESQHFITGKNISADWWTLYHSKVLNDLINHALAANSDLKAAQAALDVARENVLAQKGTYFPTATGSFNANRQRTSSYLAPIPNSNALYFNLYTPQLSVAFVPDVFGLNRRTVENLQAQSDQARYALIATQVTLTSNIVAAAIQEASLKEQIEVTQKFIAANEEMLDIQRNQLAKGSVSLIDLANQQTQLAQAIATLPPLRKQLQQQQDLLTALAGELPGQDKRADFRLADLKLPQEIPVSLSSQLVAQRPDIGQARENLHAASAQIGIAVANRLPNLTLSGNIGTMALTTGEIFTGPAAFATVAGAVAQPIFDGGMLMHKERAARDAYTQANAQYESTVVTAFQNVADSLGALQEDAHALKAAEDAKVAADHALELTRQQYESGLANRLAFLTAEQAQEQATLVLIQAQANRYADTAALFQALGGGWWNEPTRS